MKEHSVEKKWMGWIIKIKINMISTNQQAICPPNEVWETARSETAKDIPNSIHSTINYTNLFWSVFPLPLPARETTLSSSLPSLQECMISASQQTSDRVWETERDDCPWHSKLDTQHHYTSPLSYCYDPTQPCSILQLTPQLQEYCSAGLLWHGQSAPAPDDGLM